MKKPYSITPIILFLLAILSLSCQDNKEEIAAQNFEISSEYLTIDVDKGNTSLNIPINTTLELTQWEVSYEVNWIQCSKQKTATQGTYLKVSVNENTGKKRSASIKITSLIGTYTITLNQYAENDIIIEGDIQIEPIDGKDSEHQPGQDITNTYDGKFSTDGGSPFHTPWGQSAHFPVTLEYYFRGDTEIDYLIYYTRSGNGNFGELEIFVATDSERKNYVSQGKYDFKMQNSPSKVVFNAPVKATGIKFVVTSGLSDFVSCDEMQFFKRNTEKPLDKQLLTVFKDITCTELKLGVTQETINALPTYFIRIAQALQNDTYDEWEKKFRIHNYEAYSNVEEWAEKLMTKRYSNLDNPTGIYVTQGDEIIVLVGDTHGQNVTLQCIGEVDAGNYLQTASSGDSYFLEEGVNKLTMRGAGQLFIMYNTDLTSLTATPIKIHIPLGSGKVTGYFDLKTDKTDEVYADLLSKATHKYFCVRGEKIMFYFHRTKMLDYVRNNILSAINLWDNIIGWQQELMGIENVRPSQVNNHLFAISPEGSYMWASDYQIGFVYTYLGNILLYDNVMAAEDNAWGPAHEIGHIHQQAINWPGSTESSNNLFSNYIIYKLGKYKSRGNGLIEIATSRYVNKQAWYNMGEATHQGEDTEAHMRMNWQLWNYYHRCGYKSDFWQTLFKLLRENRINESNPGAGQLLFAKMASKAANENLTDFFEMWGFFEPVNSTIEQYGTYKYHVTTSMINEAKEYMAQFPTPKHAFQYIEDRKKNEFPTDDYRYKEVGDVGYYTSFKDNTQITKNIIADVQGQKVSIKNGEEAVAFEIKREGKLIYFSNFFEFEVPSSIRLDSSCEVYAVQADGKRIKLR